MPSLRTSQELSSGEEPSDLGLVRLVAAGDEAALRAVIARHGGLVFGLARRVIGDPTLAEEAAQDCFVALWKAPERFDPERGALRDYLAGIVKKKAIDVLRRERHRSRLVYDVVDRPWPAESESVDTHDLVRSSLEKLSSLQREAIFLAYFAGLTYKEVAETLAIPEGTAKTRLRDGLLRLRVVMGSVTAA